ncbi:DUF3419 family protein [Synechococcus sp. CBW1006]|uniref:DUF3419 family protein n=1 Tax=Synechococcus sp. CBW1006 TaxID=1353138 RepID=UPI0018CC88D1|nr:DUF3419 family protein [Synechococcus sp. CBW1006]QPN66667.1 DUF3419 family protein [Synechococcus sp. CBW1006]
MSHLLYGQCWEDADRLVEALAPLQGCRVLSIASGGENSLALLAEGASQVVAIDRHPAQIALLALKAAAYGCLDPSELLVFLGAWEQPEEPATGDLSLAGPQSSSPAVGLHRLELYRRCRERLDAASLQFWDRQPQLIAAGVLQAGRFERYLARFRRWIVPRLADPDGWQALLEGLNAEERSAWFQRRWQSRGQRLLLHLVFSRLLLGGLGTSPQQVLYGKGSQSRQLVERLRHALIALDPAENPYLHWILRGRFGAHLPRALRPEVVPLVRRNLAALRLQTTSLEAYLASTHPSERFDRFNLSNLFDYQSPLATAELLGALRRRSAPGGRLVCWNRHADRDCRLAPPASWQDQADLAAELHRRDRVFFYKRLVVADARMDWSLAGEVCDQRRRSAA